MTVIFESILPIFLLVFLGVCLKRYRRIDLSLWEGLEQLGYFVLFPALLFSTLATADFSGMRTDSTAVATIGSITLMSACLLGLWPIMRQRGVSAATFTSVFQTATRWNGFMALAIAQKLYGPIGLTLTALVMTLIIIPINLYNVGVLVWFNGGPRGLRFFTIKIITNPLIVASVAGIVLNLFGGAVYAPVMTAIEMLAAASLSLGLVMVGAGLKVSDALKPRPVAVIAVFLKLIAMPIFMVSASYLLGMRGPSLSVIALGASVPTAMNGYLLAKQMGGDAPLYAAVATIQTVVSFFTIPLVLVIADYVAGG
ncbi:putative permease [Pararhizobium capsulatum DSM 1112]|uniref:Permease n=1 Tax=Pararhizobium capsulatum DSM 1112 TaxID=1121113 RepID=A0ABU0BQ09_9HYPH|nr:AEC family transporter [Pararhizobium capsulatum]MDQ0320328.1 putative permease [Pararhizobium capsulatum DSM 1112]